MNDDEIIDSFVTLFRGRGDAYGSAKGFCVHKPLNRAVFAQHLTSTNLDDHIGVYCMIGDKCSWGCIDIDGKDFALEEPCVSDCQCDGPHTVWDWEKMRTLARNLQAVLAAKNIPAHRERSKNGFHVWVFPNHPLVSAATMRRALMAACKAIGYDPKEVNPKAEGPRAGTKGLGNFVRLPYGGCLSGGRLDRVFEQVYLPAACSLADFMEAMNNPAEYARLEDLEAVAALWTPPPVPSHEIDFDAGLDALNLTHLLDGRAYIIWRDGPLEGSDRSTTLARLAYMCAERGLTATQAFAVVRSADQRWGKFHGRDDCNEQLARFIEKAYA